MFLQSQNLRTVAATTTNYLAIAGLTTGAFMLGGPITLGVGAIFVGAMVASSLKAHKDIINDDLVIHPERHRFSPNLGKIVQNVFKKSGLENHKPLIYDFKIDNDSVEEKEGLSKLIAKMIRKVAKMPNAAAINLDKPTVIISEPLLELLNDHEEEAVIAHECAHIVAKRHRLTMPQKLLGGALMVSNAVVMIGQLLATGVVGVAATVASGIGVQKLFKKLHPKGDKIITLKEKMEADIDDEDPRSLAEIREAKQVTQLGTLFTQATVAGVATWFNPAYLPSLIAVKALNTATKYFMQSQSQTNEYQADRVAVQEIGSDPLSLITALRKLTIVQQRSINDAWEGNPPPKPGWLKRNWKESFASHPATHKRIERLASIAKEMGIEDEKIHAAVHDPVHVPEHIDIPLQHIKMMAKTFVGNTQHFATASRFTSVHDIQASRAVNVNTNPAPFGPKAVAA